MYFKFLIAIILVVCFSLGVIEARAETTYSYYNQLSNAYQSHCEITMNSSFTCSGWTDYNRFSPSTTTIVTSQANPGDTFQRILNQSWWALVLILGPLVYFILVLSRGSWTLRRTDVHGYYKDMRTNNNAAVRASLKKLKNVPEEIKEQYKD